MNLMARPVSTDKLELLAEEWEARAQEGEGENMHTEGGILNECADQLRATLRGEYEPDPEQYREPEEEDEEGWADEDDDEGEDDTADEEEG